MLTSPILSLPAAFSRETLLNSRWLLGGVPRDCEGIWRDLLEMNDGKQHLFLQRVILVHTIAKKKAGKAQVLRLPAATWNQEADVSCLAGAVLEKMQSFRDPQNLLTFPGETIKAVMNRFIEGTLDLGCS
jgi:hypothetical protein